MYDSVYNMIFKFYFKETEVEPFFIINQNVVKDGAMTLRASTQVICNVCLSHFKDIMLPTE